MIDSPAPEKYSLNVPNFLKKRDFKNVLLKPHSRGRTSFLKWCELVPYLIPYKRALFRERGMVQDLYLTSYHKKAVL